MASIDKYQFLPPLTDDELASLRESVTSLGVLQPVVVDEDGNVLDGHHRAAIAADIGIDCPSTVVAGLTEEQKIETSLVLNLGRRHLDTEQKQALVSDLRNRGLSVRWISEKTGIPKSTVGRIAAGVPSGTPDRVVGKDGKSYSSSRPQPTRADYPAHHQMFTNPILATAFSALVMADDAEASALYEQQHGHRPDDLGRLFPGGIDEGALLQEVSRLMALAADEDIDDATAERLWPDGSREGLRNLATYFDAVIAACEAPGDL